MWVQATQKARAIPPYDAPDEHAVACARRARVAGLGAAAEVAHLTSLTQIPRVMFLLCVG